MQSGPTLCLLNSILYSLKVRIVFIQFGADPHTAQCEEISIRPWEFLRSRDFAASLAGSRIRGSFGFEVAIATRPSCHTPSRHNEFKVSSHSTPNQRCRLRIIRPTFQHFSPVQFRQKSIALIVRLLLHDPSLTILHRNSTTTQR